jgi:anti-sigma B factor antagonist
MDRSPPAQTVELVPDACCAVIRLRGEVDIASVDQASEATRQAIDLEQVRHLVVDCRELDFMDSSGVKMLLEAHQAFQGQVALWGPKYAVSRVFEVTGVDDLFEVVDSLEDARERLHARPEAEL